MLHDGRNQVASTLSGICEDLGTVRYELETVKDIEEANRIVVRAEERVRRLANQLGFDLSTQQTA